MSERHSIGLPQQVDHPGHAIGSVPLIALADPSPARTCNQIQWEYPREFLGMWDK